MKQVNLRIYRTILPLLLGLFLSVGAYAQNITVKGNVKDATGEPVIGANVLEKGTTNGVITDLDGNFQLQTSAGATLVVSFVGYLPAEVKAASVLNVVLKEDAQLLDDVVVIGYATGSQRTISGAVQKVGREEMNAGVVVNPLSAIKGKVAGVKIFRKPVVTLLLLRLFVFVVLLLLIPAMTPCMSSMALCLVDWM